MNSLQTNCFEQLENQTVKNASQILPSHLYEDYVEYLQGKNFDSWAKKMKVVNLELNIEEMDVNQDMFLDDLTHHIYIKKKIKEEDEESDVVPMMVDGEEENEFEMYHEFQDETGNYPAYYQIAQAWNYIEN